MIDDQHHSVQKCKHGPNILIWRVVKLEDQLSPRGCKIILIYGGEGEMQILYYLVCSAERIVYICICLVAYG